MKRESQNKRIKAYLELGNTVTVIKARYMFGCERLAARIYDLKKIGMNIDSSRVTIISFGIKKIIARYKLVK